MKNRFLNFISFLLCINLIFMPSFVYANSSGGAWSQSEVIRNGATSIYNGLKKVGEQTWKGVSSFTPNVVQVSKQIVRVGSVGAVTTAVDMLLGEVDWVLDPANNRVIYYDITSSNHECSTSHISLEHAKSDNRQFYSFNKSAVAEFMCKKTLGENATFTGKFGKLEGRSLQVTCKIDSNEYINTIYCDIPPAYLPIETVAQKVIDNANAKDDESVRFVATVADANVTQQDKENDWERTKSPAVPGTGTNTANPDTTNSDTANPAKDDTNTQNPPNTANPDKPSDKPFELPTFCGWAPVVCETLSKIAQLPDTLAKWVESAKEWVKEFFKPKDEKTEIDIDVSNDERPDTNIRFNALCPAPVTLIDMNFFGSRIYHQFTYDKFCEMLQNLRPIIIAVGSFIAVLIVGGVRTKDE